jgi:hypothetical protein
MEDLLPHIIILGLYSTCLIIKDNNDNDDGVDNDDHHVSVGNDSDVDDDDCVDGRNNTRTY